MMTRGLAQSPRGWQDIGQVIDDPAACHAAEKRDDCTEFHAHIIAELTKLKNDVSYL